MKNLQNETIVLYTGINLDMLETEGGSGYWDINESRIKNIDYLIAVKNHNPVYATDTHKVPQGTAFLIAKVSGMFTEQCAKYKGKRVITLSEYAEICIPNAWLSLTETGGLPARRYFDTQKVLDTLNINLNKLEWKPFTPKLPYKPHSRRYL